MQQRIGLVQRDSMDGAHKLDYFVEWRPRIWAPAVDWALANRTRFAGKRVLEIGCRYGKMSCLFAMLGAQVHGVDIEPQALDRAHREAEKWRVTDRVEFSAYDGNAGNIPGEGYDFVFTKSVLVVVPQLDRFLAGVAQKMTSHGELLAVENWAGNQMLNWFRRSVIHRRSPNFGKRFHGVDRSFVAQVEQHFLRVTTKSFYGLAVAIRAVGRR